jgi:hypothetical protein
MRFDDASNGLSGVYVNNNEGEYYCVWIKDRSPKDIADTENHEICHYLIANDKENHFCG